MDNDNKQAKNYADRSGAEIALELGRLLLLLLWKIFRQGLRIAARFLLFVIVSAHDGWERLVTWWNDNDTQVKVAKLRAMTARWCKAFGHWCVRAFWATLRWLKVAAIALGHGIIHLRTTAITLAHLAARGWRAFVAWLRRCRRGMRLWHLRRKRAYRQFRRNKGFKGLLIDTTAYVRRKIAGFIDEGEDAAHPDATTEDDLLMEQLGQRIGEDTRAGKLISKARGWR